MVASAIRPSSRTIDTVLLSSANKSADDVVNLESLFSELTIVDRIDRPSERKVRVLMVGEGDFSYALSYAIIHPDHEIVATSYESEKAMNLRQDWAAKKRQLSQRGVALLHSVDATRLGRDRRIQGVFDRVIFNFPHTGQRSGATAALIQEFFLRSRSLLRRGGEVWMGLMDSAHYDGTYGHRGASRRSGFKLVSRKKWDADGSLSRLGYRHEETKRRQMPAAARQNPGLSYQFSMADSDDETFNRNDEFFHSSDLFDDEGRLKKPVNVKQPVGEGSKRLTHAQFRKRRLLEFFDGKAAAEAEVRRLRRAGNFRGAERVLKLLAEGYPKTTLYWEWRARNFRDLGREDRAKECDGILNNL